MWWHGLLGAQIDMLRGLASMRSSSPRLAAGDSLAVLGAP
jgi:hypothetical protein